MQPDTTPTKIVQDILAKLNSKQQSNPVNTNKSQESSNGNTQESENAHRQAAPVDREYPKDTTCPTATYQVMPLFAPDGASIMFFCIHPAGRYAMNLVPISAAFKTQVRKL